MGRSHSLVSLLLVASLPVACAFSKASLDEIRGDGGAVPVDVRPLDGSMTGGEVFQSDANVTCVKTQSQAMNLPPDILILFDRSGSMQEDLTGMSCNGGCGATSKWTVATTTMGTFLPTTEAAVNWGLKLFGSSSSGCDVNNRAEVAPAAMNATAINTALAAAKVGSSTPTTAGLMNSAAYLKTLTDSNPKFILLATDGIPTCGKAMCAAGVNTGGGMSTNTCDDANAIAMVKTVHDMGYPVFVLGIGTSSSPGDGTLSQMAVNGGFPRNATPSYYPIDSANDLTDAFKSITSMVGKCFFAVTPALTGLEQVSGVTADGTDLAPGDYMIVGKSGVQLLGAKCDDFTAGTIKNVAVQVSCNG